MSNAFQDRVGVTAEERVTNALSLTPLGGTKNVGLLVERVRGVDGKILQTTGLKEDVRMFGGHSPNMYSSYVVENLFNNTGGYPVNVFQVRIVGAGSTPATTILKNASTDLQTFIHATTQNYVASPLTAQIDKMTFGDIGVGDTFKYTVTTTTGTPINEIFTFTADSEDAVALRDAFITAINTKMVTLNAGIEATADGNNSFIVTSNASAMTSVTQAINNTTAENILGISAGYQGSPDKGTWGNSLRVRVYPIGHTDGSEDGYMMRVFYQGYLVETFVSVGADWQTLIEQVNSRSEYIMLTATDLTKALTLGVFDSALSGGVYNAPTENDFAPRYHEVTLEPMGMNLFEGSDVHVVACPEVFTSHFAGLCEAFAINNRKFFIFNMPYLATEATLQAYYNALMQPGESFVAGYLNWVEVSAGSGTNKIWIPSIGGILGGGYVKKSALNNGYVWIPPAGIETVLRGVYRITHDSLSDAILSRYIKKWKCNTLKFIKNTGYIVWASRTYSNNALFESIHVRLETNWIIDNLLTRNVKVLQNLISPSSMRTARMDNLIWFKNIYENGGIEQSVPFDEAVVITMEQGKENRKEVEMDISWIPAECTEHVHLRLNRNDGILLLNFTNS